MMLSQFNCSIETLWTFTADIRLHSFMSLNMLFKVTIVAEFLLTNVTCEPTWGFGMAVASAGPYANNFHHNNTSSLNFYRPDALPGAN